MTATVATAEYGGIISSHRVSQIKTSAENRTVSVPGAAACDTDGHNHAGDSGHQVRQTGYVANGI
jgi:hypothetical protein